MPPDEVNLRLGDEYARRTMNAQPAGAPAYSPTSEAGYLAWFDHTYGYAKSTGALLDGRLSLLLDRSNTYTIAQGTSGNQPLWSNNGILGRAAAYYTTDDWMSTLDGVLAGILDGSQTWTIYSVVDRDTSLQANTVFCLGDSAASTQNATYRTTGAGVDFHTRLDGTGAAGGNGTQSPGTSAVRLTAAWDSANVLSWVGSSASVSASSTKTPVCDRFFVGAQRSSGALSSFMSGWVGDILIFTAVHDAAARARVWAYLQTLYVGLT